MQNYDNDVDGGDLIMTSAEWSIQEAEIFIKKYKSAKEKEKIKLLPQLKYIAARLLFETKSINNLIGI